MIRIIKPDTCPEILKTDGVAQTSKDCDEFNICPKKYLSGERKLPAKLNKIYGHISVQNVLMEAQRNKCCYCERCRESAELDVEHFRPKGAVKQSRGGEKLYPGYYWLAYNWANLYLSCKKCNTGWKGILFPLANPEKRARRHKSKYKISDEQPLFINPGVEDPRKHIRFRNDSPYPLTKKGKITIKELGLLADKRPLLREARLKKLRVLQYFCEVVKYSKEEPANVRLAVLANTAKKRLKELAHPTAEFSSMARDYISNYFKQL